MSRTTLYLMFTNWFWHQLYADDYSWSAAGAHLHTDLVPAVYWQVVLGITPSWHKFRGGPHTDWIGLWVVYERFAIGLNERRRSWLIAWLQRLLDDEFVLVQKVADGLGRLTFGCLAVPEIKPLLGPYYAWCSSVPS